MTIICGINNSEKLKINSMNIWKCMIIMRWFYLMQNPFITLLKIIKIYNINNLIKLKKISKGTLQLSNGKIKILIKTRNKLMLNQ